MGRTNEEATEKTSTHFWSVSYNTLVRWVSISSSTYSTKSPNLMSPCHVSVVLLCMGPGGDPDSFRPSRDDSQYWCRRDALVRCVTSFLFGPGSSPNNRDMILIFDDDRAYVHLSLAADAGDIIPTEQLILSLFKKAAKSLNRTVTSHGLICRTVMDPVFAFQQQETAFDTELPSGLSSKREVLAYIQWKCSIDFLRKHGLNSSTSAILRKSNINTLSEVWAKWRKLQAKETKTTKTCSSDQQATESLFRDVVQSFQTRAEKDEIAIVGTLHESCDEFPCFEPDSGGQDHRYRIMLFLGAVRDMTPGENRILEDVCKSLQVPRVGIRFGTVSEFTSKILSVLAYHQSHPMIMRCALSRLLAPSKQGGESAIQSRSPTCLHVIGHVPIKSAELSIDLTRRDRTHWCIVRVVVCTLWRSRLASCENSADHVNSLTLIFEDGVSVSLEEGTFVAKLAAQHQAAPSEYQILAAIRSLLDSKRQVNDSWSDKMIASSVVDTILASSSETVTSAISITPTNQGDNVSKSFFQTSKCDGHEAVASCRAAILVLDLHRNLRDVPKKPSKMHRAILTAATKRNLLTVTTSIISSGMDYEPSSITCLQHFLYHNRLFLCENRSLSGAKRKASNS